MAAVQPFPNAAFVKVETDFTSNWNTATPSYTDTTADVRFPASITWSRGRNDEFQSVGPGSAQWTWGNRTRTYDPTTNANMVPARPARITCYYPTIATAYAQIDLQAEDFVPVWEPGGDSVVQVNCIERFGGLAFAKIASAVFISTTAVGRLTDLANAGGWPASKTAWTTGRWPLTASVPVYGPNVEILGAMQDVAAGQEHVLYQDRTGVLTTKLAFAGTSTSIGTFGDAAGEIPFVSVDDGVGGGYWYTQVALTYAQKYGPDGEKQSPSDTITATVGANRATAKYGTRTFAVSIAAMALTDAVNAAAAYAASLNTQTNYRIKQIVLKPMTQPAVMFPIVLGADLGNVITVNLTPPGGGSRITQTGKIRSIQHEISETDWVVTWQLSP